MICHDVIETATLSNGALGLTKQPLSSQESHLDEWEFDAFFQLVERPNPKKSIIKGDNWSDERPYDTMHRFHP